MIATFLIRFRLIGFTLASIIGLYFLWDPRYLILTIISYFLFVCLGHDIALHRYYSHRSFTCNKFCELFLWFCTFISGLTDPYSYAQRHRNHHKHSDTEYDNLQPTKHPILTWIGFGATKLQKTDFSKINMFDFANRPAYLFAHKYYFLMYYSFLTIMLLIDFKVSLYFFIIGTALAFNTGSAVNVICHRYGYRNFNITDRSTNNYYLNMITFGLGLHHNHHKYPFAYTHKVKDSETDISGWIIKNLLATTVRTFNK
jgi:stearoyl-CoA desaturase (delta-9 desaturase)